MNSNKKDTIVPSAKDEVTFPKDINETGVTNQHITTDLPVQEKIGESTEITSLTKSSPSMLNELADAIIAENFDALKDDKETTVSPMLASSKDTGTY